MLAAVRFHYGEEPPGTLDDAWGTGLEERVLDSCHMDGVFPDVATTLLAYDSVRHCLADPSEHTLLSSDWPDLLDPSTRQGARVSHEHFHALEAITGELRRLVVLRDRCHDDRAEQVVESLAPGTREMVGDFAQPGEWFAAFQSQAGDVVDAHLRSIDELMRAVHGRLVDRRAVYYTAFLAVVEPHLRPQESDSDSG